MLQLRISAVLTVLTLAVSLSMACGGDTNNNVHTIKQGNVDFTLEVPQGWVSGASRAERREGMNAAFFAGEQFQDFDNSFTTQVEIHYTPEVTVPSGYTRAQEVELLESYREGYEATQTRHYKITSSERGDFAGYPALLFTSVDDGTERAGFTNKHIAFLADRKLLIFQCRYWPGLDEMDDAIGDSCDGIIASVKSK